MTSITSSPSNNPLHNPGAGTLKKEEFKSTLCVPIFAPQQSVVARKTCLGCLQLINKVPPELSRPTPTPTPNPNPQPQPQPHPSASPSPSPSPYNEVPRGVAWDAERETYTPAEFRARDVANARSLYRPPAQP